MELSTVEEGNTTFTEIKGRLPDQAALMGVLDELYNYAIPVIFMECIGVGPYKKEITMNLADYNEHVTLKSGLAARLRAVRPDDKGRFLDMFHNLEPESIYTRFFRVKKTLTDDELRKITEVDFKDVAGLVVTIGDKANETIIGAGRDAAIDAPDGTRSAEVYITVAEGYAGQGIAGLLLRRLASIARSNGVVRFEAEVLPQNRAMLAVFEHSGLSPRVESEDDTLHVTMPLMNGGS
jgi:RimJ/RimL family protein N-acetyltransferase